MDGHEAFMEIALTEARAGLAAGEQPFGSVIAGNGKVIAQARSLKVSTSDSTAHSELLAIQAATTGLGRRTLEGCVFYGTCEPCPMCLGAMFNAGLRTLVLGARLRDLGDVAFSFKDYSVESFAALTGWELTLIEGVRQAECTALYVDSTIEFTR
jgi:tRNA(adenine34) deaminase